MNKAEKLIVICNGRACKKYGSDRIIQALKKIGNDRIKITTKYCFGKCGNGVTVLILPEGQFYPNINNEKEIINLLKI
ncbi:hypothetical protein Cyast_0831 [Cyanobacterium stanieri PCC 7202]|uniref:(2Fe-2S) ferredoxin domain-containing protein n=1 Tax=Cyanobacterium stanieri (strain ATCC 29140 / PCC 7202) TaxID=292563 RepID=K9YL34_CYASC|nr:hypothetical protein Cyast_0831 [Cyanobacterium stanieri PCC 7202]